MRKNKNKILLSANDLISFLECQHKIFLGFQNLETPLDVKEDEHALLIKTKGLEHEAEYLQSLKDDGHEIVEIPTNPSIDLHNREQMTSK
jgi:uncharacterized protein